MTRVIVAGAAGRMGQRISYMVHQHPALTLAGGFERPEHPAIGKDIGEIAAFGTTGVTISAGLDAVIDQGDVIIDFTFHEATMAIARKAAQKAKAMVIGTTGLEPENLAELGRSCQEFSLCPGAQYGGGGQRDVQDCRQGCRHPRPGL